MAAILPGLWALSVLEASSAAAEDRALAWTIGGGVAAAVIACALFVREKRFDRMEGRAIRAIRLLGFEWRSEEHLGPGPVRLASEPSPEDPLQWEYRVRIDGLRVGRIVSDDYDRAAGFAKRLAGVLALPVIDETLSVSRPVESTRPERLSLLPELTERLLNADLVLDACTVAQEPGKWLRLAERRSSNRMALALGLAVFSLGLLYSAASDPVSGAIARATSYLPALGCAAAAIALSVAVREKSIDVSAGVAAASSPATQQGAVLDHDSDS